MLDQQEFEADLIFTLNKVLQKVGKEMRFYRVKYISSRVVFALSSEKANIGLIVP